MNPYIFKRKDEPIAIINLTEDGSIVNYKLNSKYERYICGIKQKRIVALVISLQKRQSFYYFRLLINFIIKCYGIFLAHGIKYAFDFHHDSFEPSDQLLENEACPYVFVSVLIMLLYWSIPTSPY